MNLFLAMLAALFLLAAVIVAVTLGVVDIYSKLVRRSLWR